MMAALLDHLWQSTLFAAAIALVMPLFRRQAASLRFWLWFAASMKFLVPFALLVALGRHVLDAFAPAVTAPLLTAIHPAAARFIMAAPLLAPSPVHIPAAELAVIVWAVGLIAISLFCLSRWLDLRASLREAYPVAADAPVPVKSAASFLEPGLVGVWRPVILLPKGLAQQLTQAEMDAVLAHELCHLRRRDNLLAALHMLVEGLFWFHPLVWWIGGRLVEERERACDESVVASGIRPLTYAEGILKICRFYVQSPLACASGVSGADLQMRLGAIMAGGPRTGLDASRRMLLAGMAVMTLLPPLTAGMLGTAPVSRLAAHVAAALEAPQRMQLSVAMPQVEMAAPFRKQVRAHHAAVLPSQPDVLLVAQDAISARLAAVDIGPVVTVMPQVETVTVRPARDEPPLVCRRGELLPGSRLRGPEVCLDAARWAELKAKEQDVSPDGRSLVATDYERERNVKGHNCQIIQTGSATSGGGMGMPLCF
jgi:beta-lactamase regulating signal transducer with metallopeptidase domain